MSDVVIASNQSIKVERIYFYNSFVPTGTSSVITGNVNGYVEVDYIEWTGAAGGDNITFYDEASGDVLFTANFGSAPEFFSFSKIQENFKNFVLVSGSGIAHPKKMVLPAGTGIRVTRLSTNPNNLRVIGSRFINSP